MAIGESSVQLQFLEPENPKAHRDIPRSSVTTLRVGGGDNGGDFADKPGEKIEKHLEDIVKTILVLAETEMRSFDFSCYKRKLERKSQMLHEIAEQKRKEEERRLAAIAARKAAIKKRDCRRCDQPASRTRHSKSCRGNGGPPRLGR